MSPKPTLRAVYDSPADVMHLVLGEPQMYEGDGLDGGLEIDYAIETGEPCEAKVIGFCRYGWTSHLDELAEVLAERLSIPKDQALEAISDARERSVPWLARAALRDLSQATEEKGQ